MIAIARWSFVVGYTRDLRTHIPSCIQLYSYRAVGIEAGGPPSVTKLQGSETTQLCQDLSASIAGPRAACCMQALLEAAMLYMKQEVAETWKKHF